MNPDDNTIVLLDTFSTAAEAHIVAGMLEDNGIHCSIDNETFSSVYPIGFNSIGGIRIMVLRQDLEAAIKLLAADSDL